MYNVVESLRSAFQSIRAHALRSFLTTLGIIIAVMSVIAVVSLIQGFVSAKLNRRALLVVTRSGGIIRLVCATCRLFFFFGCSSGLILPSARIKQSPSFPKTTNLQFLSRPARLITTVLFCMAVFLMTVPS